MKKVVISADSTCDLGNELKEKWGIHYFPYHINSEGKDYLDNVTITPDDLYAAYRERKALPKTSAINAGEYIEYFKQFTDEGCEVVHINLGSALSASHQNALIAADELDGVYPVDSQNLSTGTGLLVLKACKMANEGLSAKEISDKLKKLTPYSHASFVLNTLEFMRAGGRCSAVAAFGANLLGIKPSITVDNRDGGRMSVGKKYRGKFDKVLLSYAEDVIAKYPDYDDETVFITHSGTSSDYIHAVKKYLLENTSFKNIYVTKASCTISCHCGPDTLGVLFMTKS